MKKEELIKVNFHAEIEAKIVDEVNFIREEFDHLFSQKTDYTKKDRELAAGLINYLAKTIDTPISIDHLSQTLEELEFTYPNLF